MDSYDIFCNEEHMGTVNMPCLPPIGTMLYIRDTDDIKNHMPTRRFKVVSVDFSILLFKAEPEIINGEFSIKRPTARPEIKVEEIID